MQHRKEQPLGHEPFFFFPFDNTSVTNEYLLQHEWNSFEIRLTSLDPRVTTRQIHKMVVMYP